MSANLDVTRTGDGEPLTFAVAVRDAAGGSRHTVTLSINDCDRLTTAGRTRAPVPPERIVEAAFRFLLDREPKEVILAAFDVSVIARYFPEFERELPRYLAGP